MLTSDSTPSRLPDLRDWTRAPSAKANAAALTILVVDDDRAQRRVVCRVLNTSGYRTHDVDSGESALAWLDSQQCDAVLLDACMPGIGGFETCRRLRALPAFRGLPVIIATGLEDEGSIERAFAAGATDYVIKPLNWPILRRRLRVLVASCRAEQRSLAAVQASRTLLRESNDAWLLLDPEGSICDSRGIDRLPEPVHREFRVGRCLFDTLTQSARAPALCAWRTLTETGERQNFMIADHDSAAPYVVEARLIKGENDQTLCILRDGTAAYLAEQQILSLSFRDAATGLANAAKVRESLTERIRRNGLVNRQTGIIRCLIDNYGDLSRRLDLAGMQQLSEQVALRLQGLLNDEGGDVLAGRLSDNEFALLSGPLEDERQLQQMAKQVQRVLAPPYPADDSQVVLQFSIGLATTATAGTQSDQLLAAAADACHDQSADSGCDIRVYSEQLRRSVTERNELERLLRRDIEADALMLHYQPKFAVGSLALVGMEALARWQPSELGPVSPGQFIPVAQSCGLLDALTDRVIEMALDQALHWQQAGIDALPVSVNLPGDYLSRPDAVERLRLALATRDLSANWLEVEITENSMVELDGTVLDNLRELRLLGIRVAVDDFGTGYSSLSYLRELPIDVLKIDISFIRAIHRDETAAAIVRAIVSVGHEIGLEVVAEGVEVKPQLECLQTLSCDVVQGYYTGRPVDAEQFEPLFSLSPEKE